MIERIRRFFDSRIAGAVGDDARPGAREEACRLATAALLLETGRADFEVKGVEREAIARAVRAAFDLDPEEVRRLLELAEDEAREATSLYPFTRLVNDHFAPAEKARVLELMWQVAFADGEVDRYEEHLIRRVADLIHVPHRDFIRAKHRAAGRRA